MSVQKDLASGSMVQTIVKMTVPIVAANFLQTGYNLIDTFFVSRIGSSEVAAVTFVMPIAFLVMSVAGGLSTAGISLISQSTGAGNAGRVNEYAGHVFLLGLVLSVVIGVTGYILAGQLGGFVLSGKLLVAVRDYSGFIFLATPFTFFNVIYSGVRNSEGFAQKSLIVMVSSLLLNVLFNYLFIFRLGLGIRGAALATLCARSAAAVYGILDLRFGSKGFRINFGGFRFSPATTGLIVRLGIPAALARGTTALSFVVLNLVIVEFGVDVLTAFGIGSRINSIFFMPSTGFGIALSAIVGQNLGAGKEARARRAVRLTLGISGLFSLVAAVILNRFSRGFASIFSSDLIILNYTIDYLKLVAITVIPWGVFQTLTGVFQGAGFTKTAMTISLIRLWVLRIPLLILLKTIPGVEEFSIWYSMLISNTLTAIASAILYYVIPWKRGLQEVIAVK